MHFVSKDATSLASSDSGRNDRDSGWPLNQWYCAAYSDEVSGQPLARTLLNRQIVLYRTESAGPVALTDRCPHRKAPLSGGAVTDDVIECPFHGMQFATDGRCIRIPSQDRIPPGAHVRSFPVAERDGHVWIWMGDAPAADPSLIPDMHWLIAPEMAAFKGIFHLHCNYRLAIDNLLDDTHLPFVHRNTIGTAKMVSEPIRLEGDDDWVGFTRWTLDTPPSAVHAKAGGFTTNVDRWSSFKYVRPTTVLIDVGSAPVGTGAPQGDRSKGINMFSNGTITPISENSCYYFWHLARNYNVDDDDFTEVLRAEVTKTFVEDVEIVEQVQRSIDCEVKSRPELLIAGDAVCLRARKIIASLIAAETSAP